MNGKPRPVMVVYAPDGRTAIIAKSEFDAWRKVGWNGIANVPFPYLQMIEVYRQAMTMGEKTVTKIFEKYKKKIIRGSPQDDKKFSSSVVVHHSVMADSLQPQGL